MDWFEQVWSRVVPEQGVALSGAPVVVVLVVALVVLGVRLRLFSPVPREAHSA